MNDALGILIALIMQLHGIKKLPKLNQIYHPICLQGQEATMNKFLSCFDMRK